MKFKAPGLVALILTLAVLGQALFVQTTGAHTTDRTIRIGTDRPLGNTARKSATGAEDTGLLRCHRQGSKSDLGEGIRLCRF